MAPCDWQSPTKHPFRPFDGTAGGRGRFHRIIGGPNRPKVRTRQNGAQSPRSLSASAVFFGLNRPISRDFDLVCFRCVRGWRGEVREEERMGEGTRLATRRRDVSDADNSDTPGTSRGGPRDRPRARGFRLPLRRLVLATCGICSLGTSSPLDHVAQALDGEAESALYRSKRDTESACCLTVGQAPKVGEFDDDSLFVRESAKRIAHLACL